MAGVPVIYVARAEAQVSEIESAPEAAATVCGPVRLVDKETGLNVGAVVRMKPATMPALRDAALHYYADGSGVVRITSGFRSASTSFGFRGPQPMLQVSGCQTCGGAAYTPAPHSELCAAAAEIADAFTAALPEEAQAQTEIARVVPEGWHLPGRMWTSGVLNRNSPMPYHFDKNNIKDSWSAMVVFRQFTRGGHLHLPNLTLDDGRPVVLECADGDILFFNGQKEFHGVTPITFRRDGGYLFTAVYYTVRTLLR